MSEQQIQFDGIGYEQMMGVWSRSVGEVFLDWLGAAPGGRWVDVGCGNGAFTELLIDRCAPVEIAGVDPSPGQLAFARDRRAGQTAKFHEGDAMALPFADNAFDAAAMALVIFFVPEPSKAVAEMARVVRPGGLVATYGWDMQAGGFPHHALQTELRASGKNVPQPPHPEASRLEVLESLWHAAGLEQVSLRSITVERRFASFDEYWNASAGGQGFRQAFAAMAPEELAAFKARVKQRLTIDASGAVIGEGRANAVKGRVKHA